VAEAIARAPEFLFPRMVEVFACLIRWHGARSVSNGIVEQQASGSGGIWSRVFSPTDKDVGVARQPVIEPEWRAQTNFGAPIQRNDR